MPVIKKPLEKEPLRVRKATKRPEQTVKEPEGKKAVKEAEPVFLKTTLTGSQLVRFLRSKGMTAKQLKSKGITLLMLKYKSGLTDKDAHDLGFSFRDLVSAGYIKDLREKYKYLQFSGDSEQEFVFYLQGLGYKPAEAGFILSECKRTNEYAEL